MRTAVVAILFVAATCAYAWPLPLHLATALPHDSGDPLLVTWILWWSTHVTPLTARWWNAPAFHPSAGVFAFSENLLGLAPITAPLLWSGQPPLVAYNVAFLASFVLSGLGGYLLGMVLTRQAAPSLVAGAVFAFSPYRLSHLSHLQLLSSYWMPVCLAALHLYAKDGRRRWAVLSAGAWLAQSLACGYYLFYLSLLAVLWAAAFARRWDARRAARLAACWGAAGLLLLPLLFGYKRIQDSYGFKRVPVEMAYYSADVAGIAAASTDSLLWHSLRAIDKPESELFPGVALAAVALAGAIGAFRRRDRSTAFYCGAALLMWLLALGPSPSFRGAPLHVPGPYALLMYVPGFNGMRVPARLWMVSVLCLSAVAALVLANVRNPRARTAWAAVLLAGVMLDGWPGSFALAADPGMQVTHTRSEARLGLPLRGNETETMYGAIAQGIPVFNGYSGYTAPQHRALEDLVDRRDRRILPRLAANGPIEIIVRHELDPDGGWRQFVASTPGAHVTAETSAWTAFELEPQGRGEPAPFAAIARKRLPIAHLDASANAGDINAVADGDLDTRWHTGRQDGGEEIVADLGALAHPTSVVLCLGTYSGQYPREMEVSISVDGRTWAAAWNGDTALLTYDGAVRSPRRVPIEIPLPGTGARYVRLRQTGRDPARGWTIVELEVRE